METFTFRVTRTPWKHRLIVWPGMPFRTLPFPYLFERWEVNEDETGWYGGFWNKKEAVQHAHNCAYEFNLVPDWDVSVVVEPPDNVRG